MVGIEIVRDKASKAHAPAAGGASRSLLFVTHCQHAGTHLDPKTQPQVRKVANTGIQKCQSNGKGQLLAMCAIVPGLPCNLVTRSQLV